MARPFVLSLLATSAAARRALLHFSELPAATVSPVLCSTKAGVMPLGREIATAAACHALNSGATSSPVYAFWFDVDPVFRDLALPAAARPLASSSSSPDLEMEMVADLLRHAAHSGAASSATAHALDLHGHPGISASAFDGTASSSSSYGCPSATAHALDMHGHPNISASSSGYCSASLSIQFHEDQASVIPTPLHCCPPYGSQDTPATPTPTPPRFPRWTGASTVPVGLGVRSVAGSSRYLQTTNRTLVLGARPFSSSSYPRNPIPCWTPWGPKEPKGVDEIIWDFNNTDLTPEHADKLKWAFNKKYYPSLELSVFAETIIHS